MSGNILETSGQCPQTPRGNLSKPLNTTVESLRSLNSTEAHRYFATDPASKPGEDILSTLGLKPEDIRTCITFIPSPPPASPPPSPRVASPPHSLIPRNVSAVNAINDTLGNVTDPRGAALRGDASAADSSFYFLLLLLLLLPLPLANKKIRQRVTSLLGLRKPPIIPVSVSSASAPDVVIEILPESAPTSAPTSVPESAPAPAGLSQRRGATYTERLQRARQGNQRVKAVRDIQMQWLRALEGQEFSSQVEGLRRVIIELSTRDIGLSPKETESLKRIKVLIEKRKTKTQSDARDPSLYTVAQNWLKGYEREFSAGADHPLSEEEVAQAPASALAPAPALASAPASDLAPPEDLNQDVQSIDTEIDTLLKLFDIRLAKFFQTMRDSEERIKLESKLANNRLSDQVKELDSMINHEIDIEIAKDVLADLVSSKPVVIKPQGDEDKAYQKALQWLSREEANSFIQTFVSSQAQAASTSDAERITLESIKSKISEYNEKIIKLRGAALQKGELEGWRETIRVQQQGLLALENQIEEKIENPTRSQREFLESAELEVLKAEIKEVIKAFTLLKDNLESVMTGTSKSSTSEFYFLKPQEQQQFFIDLNNYLSRLERNESISFDNDPIILDLKDQISKSGFWTHQEGKWLKSIGKVRRALSFDSSLTSNKGQGRSNLVKRGLSFDRNSKKER